MDTPESLSLVSKNAVCFESGKGVGEDCQPKVLPKEPVGFQESAEFGEDGDYEIPSGHLVDCEAVCEARYMLRALNQSAFFL